jgi:hypothetical protein
MRMRFGAQLLMTESVHSEATHPPSVSTAVVVTICSHRKRVRASADATAVSLQTASQHAVQSAWLEKLRTLPPKALASELYAGRGFGLAVQAAKSAGAKLYILSAGLGLVAASQSVPSYGVTVSGGHAESVADKVSGEFDAVAWFSGLLISPYSRQWAEVVGHSGRILIALTRPYAAMVGASLAELYPAILARLRIFGASLSAQLPSVLSPAIAPYDRRLDAILPGTRADFSQRALFHFANSLTAKIGAHDRDADFAAVEAALESSASPERMRRPRRTDEEILRLISARLKSQEGVARILRALRDEEGVACEQSRFSRLYKTAIERRTAA